MTTTSPSGPRFEDILRDEIAAINQRRIRLGRKPLASEVGDDASKPIDTVGLALSGGGVRSAAFSLGVLQALNHHEVLRNVDYISTVSGGGYMGSSLTATMTRTGGQFVFGKGASDAIEHTPSEIKDTPAVGHLRNYSNYLIPTGARDLLTGIAIIIRGLIANLSLVLPVLLLLAAVTILANPNRTALGCHALCDNMPFGQLSFPFTLITSLSGVALFLLWALYRSFLRPERAAEFRTLLPRLASVYLLLLVAVFLLELQTFFLRGMFDLMERFASQGHDVGLSETFASQGQDVDPRETFASRGQGSFGWLTGGLAVLAAIATSVATIVTLFSRALAEIFKAANAGARLSTKIMAALGKFAFWIAGAALPLLIWLAYLYLSYWGIINDKRPPDPRAAHTACQLNLSYWGNNKPPVPAAQTACQSAPTPPTESEPTKSGPTKCDNWKEQADRVSRSKDEKGEHTPKWMIAISSRFTYSVFCPALRTISSSQLFDPILDRPMVLLYGSFGLLLLILPWFLRPNANSLYQLYRDRLSKAFLFDPQDPGPVTRNKASIDQGPDFPALDQLRVSDLSTTAAPYHLINAALNIQGSDYANQRGRNADFFLFSPCYVGSEATGYAHTVSFEKTTGCLDLATAMAISGAAASANMGSSSIRPLRPTLALLNIRLGYWLKNPRYAGSKGLAMSSGLPWRRLINALKGSTPFLWAAEITGLLSEDSNHVYVTDGGHIENLGVYELLKRRCRLIVVVDAEADFAMHFPSFITLQRYARIDLGVIVDVPWSNIKMTTCALMGGDSGANQSTPPKPSGGPHSAIGCIEYGSGERGYLLYIKSSLTGDENDYIRDYARRYERFPHETTGDQFFSGEQFEVYRALGFHIAHGVLSGRDRLEVFGSDRLLTLEDGHNEHAQKVRAALRGANNGLTRPADKASERTRIRGFPNAYARAGRRR